MRILVCKCDVLHILISLWVGNCTVLKKVEKKESVQTASNADK